MVFSWKEAAIDIAAGTCAGVAQVGVGHPLDTIKVRMQASGCVMRHGSAAATEPIAGRPVSAHTFRGPLHALQTTINKEGVRGLYKGAASPLCGAMLQNASGFFFWGLSKKLFTHDEDPDTGQLTVPGLLKAGLLTGVCCLIVENPVDLVKTQMQVQLGSNSEHHKYRGVFHAGSTIVRTRGVLGLYQAVYANALRFVPGRSIYMATFEGSFRWLRPEKTHTNNKFSSDVTFRRDYYAACFASGCVAGCCVVTFLPF